MPSKLSTINVPGGFSSKVSIINNTFLYNIPNSAGRKVLFDFALSKDWENLTPKALHEIQADGIKIEIERVVVDVLVDVLREGGIDGEEIEAVVFSRHHWDHIGDMSRLPQSTDIIVGPELKEAFLPGYPANPECPVLQTDYECGNPRPNT
ncbi:hypothetical protein BDV19DRAFT_390590 [Aspergillus venezuelensis]